MLRRATSRKRLQGIFRQNADWCQDERAHGIRKGSAPGFLFTVHLRRRNSRFRFSVTHFGETIYRLLSEAVFMRLKTSSGKHGIRTHMAIETARFSKSARQTVFDYFPFSQARPQGFEPRPTGLESVMLPLHQGRGVFDSVFGFRCVVCSVQCVVCSVQCAVCSVQNFDFEHCFFIPLSLFLLSFLKRKP